MESSILVVSDLTMRFGGLKALDHVSFAVPRGHVTGLIGPNGAGKTTMFNLISRLAHPTEGRIEYDGQNLLALKPHEVVGKGIARTFQNVGLFPNISVLDNLLLGRHVRFTSGLAGSSFGSLRSRRQEREARAEARVLLERVGLGSIESAIVRFLPYGTQKLVELARALMARPKLLLLDEPVAGMNATETQAMGAFIQRLRDEFDLSVLLVEHDMSLVMGVCDWVIVLDFGKKIAEGKPQEVQHNPAVIEAYLGEEVAVAET